MIRSRSKHLARILLQSTVHHFRGSKSTSTMVGIMCLGMAVTHRNLMILCVLLNVVFVVTSSYSTTNDDAVINTSTVDTTELLRTILNNSEPGVRPNVDGPPVVVRCGFYVVSFGSISALDMDYRVDIYLRQTWVDPRLTFTRSDGKDHVVVSSKSNIWTPDLFFPNEKSASFHRVTVPNELIRIHRNGTVVYSIRLTLTLACSMDLRNFPMDHQQCLLKMESYSYETSDMLMEWDEEHAVELDEDLQLPQFRLVDRKTSHCVKRYKTGTFPCLQAAFNLERLYGYFILQTYVPSILIVVLSWVSFWVNMDAVPARISLGVTTVLTMATQLSGSKASIPRVSYPKAIDVWMSMCMMFVFLSLVEYAFVNALSRESEEEKKAREKNEEEFAEEKSDGQHLEMPARPRQWRFRGREAAINLERVSRIVFPLVFIVFNIIYWVVYTTPRQ